MDARTHVRLGLTRLVEGDGAPPEADARWVNRLLDEVGSDHRALVMLLATLARTGVVEELRNRRAAGEAWERLRDGVVQRLGAERFLQADVARWGIESWGAALHLAPPPVPPPPAPATTTHTLARAMAPLPPARPAPPPLAPATPRPTPSSSGWFRPTTPRRPSVPLAPIPPGKFTYFSRSEILTLLAVGALYFGFQLYIVFDARRMDAARARAAANAPARRDSLVSSTRVPAPPAPTAGALPAPAEDTVVLQSGLRLVGRISLVTEARVRIADRTSGLDVEQPIENVREIAARTGVRIPAALLRLVPGRRTVPQAGPPADARTPLAFTSDEVSAPPEALSPGAYRLVVRPVLVTGDPSCRAVWDALPREAQDVRRIDRFPDRAYQMEGQPAIRWRVRPDGAFTSEVASGVSRGARYQFQLRGVVSEGGFRARSLTTTESVIKWGRTQTCQIHAEIEARPAE